MFNVRYEDLRNVEGNSGNVVENKSLYWYPTIYRYDKSDQKYYISDIWYHSSNNFVIVNFPIFFEVIMRGRRMDTRRFQMGSK